jgi:hypothetical protein
MIRQTASTLLTVLLFCLCLHGHSQCLVPPAPDACTGVEPLLTDNEILTPGTTKWFYGSATTMNQLTLKGGKLIVCGDLTVNRFYIDSGTIIIRPGARFVDGGALGVSLELNGNSTIVNYGYFQVNRNLVLNTGYATAALPNILINATASSQMYASFTYFVINNPFSFFVNNGVADFGGIITDPGAGAGSLCLGNGSQTTTRILINKKLNSYAAPNGSACVGVSQFSQFYDSLTNTPNINACLGPAHYSDSSCRPFGCKPNAWGSANQFKGCASCATIAILPVQITDCKVSGQPGMNMLSWKTNGLGSHHLFKIERSVDGKNFQVADSLPAIINQATFTWYDKHPGAGVRFYRVKCVSLLTGSTVTGPVLSPGQQVAGKSISIYPNPVKNEFFLSPANDIKRLSIVSASGKLVYEQSFNGTIHHRTVTLPANMRGGLYILQLFTTNTVLTYKLVKE